MSVNPSQKSIMMVDDVSLNQKTKMKLIKRQKLILMVDKIKMKLNTC